MSGRVLSAQDSEKNQSGKTSAYQPVVINEKLARRLSGKQNPIGKHFRLGTPDSLMTEVVGVVGNAKYDAVRQDIQPTVYRPIGDDAGTFEIRTAIDPKLLMPAISAAVKRYDENLLMTDMKTQKEQTDQNIYQERLIANVSGLFALLAVVVASVGIYGLLSYQVSGRTHEIGIRLALGAEPADVLQLVLRQGAVLAIIGVVVGTAAALSVTRYLESLLYGVKPSDPLTVVILAVLLIAVALLASFVPARRPRCQGGSPGGAEV